MKEEDEKQKPKLGYFKIGCLYPVVAGFAILWIISLFLPNCGEDSEAVAYARSLPQERLEKLYYDMERLSVDDSIPYTGYVAREGEDYPEPFSDIKASYIKPRAAKIMLEGCFDHYVHLFFEGFDKNKEHQPDRQIVLSWGEYEEDSGSEVLWKETKTKQ